MIKFNEVTWYSKLAAILFFIGVLPVLTFYIGTRYQQTKTIQDEYPQDTVITLATHELPIVPEEKVNDSIYKDLTVYEWIWTETHKGTVPESSSGGKIIPKRPGVFKIIFNTDGTVSGTTDCNSFGGTYTLEKGVLNFGPFASTLMYCEGSQEQEFLTMLQTGGLGISEHDLYLKNNQTIIFEKGRKIE